MAAAGEAGYRPGRRRDPSAAGSARCSRRRPGAAAFLIAEFLNISYLQVLVMATVPTVLYYLLDLPDDRGGLAAACEPEAIDVPPDRVDADRQLRLSLHVAGGDRAVHGVGMSAFRAVFWATVLAIGLSFLRRDTASRRDALRRASRPGRIGILGVGATTATAGIIVGVVTLTGLGLKIAGIIVALAAGRLFLTVVYSALAVWMLGLAVPVTASYIIAAVMVAPAPPAIGVLAFARHVHLRSRIIRTNEATGTWQIAKPRHAAPGLLLGLGKCPLASAGTSSKTLLQSGSDTCDLAATPLKKRSRPSRCKDGSHNTATSSRSANTAHNGSTEIGGIVLCAISVATWKSVPTLSRSRSEWLMPTLREWPSSCKARGMREWLI